MAKPVFCNGIDLQMVRQAGQFVAMIGSSGCGKTTLLRAIIRFRYAGKLVRISLEPNAILQPLPPDKAGHGHGLSNPMRSGRI